MKRPPVRNLVLPMPRFADRLQEGERLLWEGRPDTRVFTASARTEAARFILPLIPLILLLEFGVCWGSIPWSSPVTWACPALVWLVCYFGFTAQVPAQARTAAYALTSRRIFIRRLEQLTSQDWHPRIDEIPLNSVQAGLRPLSNEFGAITLGATWMAVYNTQKVLRAVPNAAAVFALLTEAQAVGPYYAKTNGPARPEPAWMLEDALRQGETILWQGEMDAGTDRQTGRWIIPMMALVMAAIGGGVLHEIAMWTWLGQGLIFAFSLAIVFPIANRDRRSPTTRTSYALTDQRVLIIGSMNKPELEIQERELPETQAMRLKHGRASIGTIIFEKKTRFMWTGQSGTVETYEFSFKHITDAEAVYGLIQAAQFGYSAQLA